MLASLRHFLLLALVFVAAPVFAQNAQKAYVRDDLASDAVRLEETLRKETARERGQKTADQLRRESQAAATQRDAALALKLMGAALAANPRDAANWFDFARLSIPAEQPNSYSNYTLRERATAAAYGAYLRYQTKPDEARALALIGELYARREVWRSSLDAYRASLAAADDARTRQIYQALREKWGFRITNYTVDSDSAAPRVCFQFSEPLAKKTDFAPFVSLGGAANAAISVDDQQLCVEGLEHGEKYAIVVRQGLPSSVGEALLKSSDYEVTVKDRSPQVRFTGKNYVLPRIGQEGVPLISVNTAKVDIDIYRIGDRNLIAAVRSDDFLKTVSQYRAREIADTDGVKVWSGSLETKREQNKDVVTAFPIAEAVGKLEPGVYIMNARPGREGDVKATSDGDDDSDQRVTQWFVVSDIGLTAFSGPDGIHVLARSIASAEPLKDVEIRLVARNNEVLATLKSDATGHVRFDPGLARGQGGLAPGMVVASVGTEDYDFLDLGQAAFDLTDRGVKGRPAAKGLDAFLYAERGVYRSGETVFLSTLLRDGKGEAVTGLPATLVVKRPDGVEFKRALVEDQGIGGRALSIPLPADAPTGTWRAQAYADPKGVAIGETTFLVEDYVPERLDVKVAPRQTVLTPGEPAEIDVDAQYLFGAPGSDLDVTGDVIVQAAANGGLPGYPGFVAGLDEESFESVTQAIEDAGKTDAKGKARISAAIPEANAPKPLEAKIVLRVGEPGGRAVERVTVLPIRAKGAQIGVRALAADGLTEGSTAQFELIAVGADGQRLARKGVTWSLYRIERRYQWYNNDGRWGYEPVKSSRRIAEGTADIAADRAVRIDAKVGWGQHKLEVKSADGESQTSMVFSVGWSGEATAETPDLLDVTLDKAAYAAGEPLKLRIASRTAGKATVAIVSEAVHAFIPVDVAAGDTNVSIPVDANWGAGAYAVVLAHRPLDKAANRAPGRALGLAWFGVEQARHRLDVTIGAEAKIRPRGTMKIPVRLAGLAAGEEAAITVSAVDLGILNLTRYETPKPFDFLFGQRQLSAEIRDLYGLLIDGMQGQRGAIRSGGDAGPKGLEGNRPTQEPLARYSGIVKVGADGTAEVAFDIPAFNGTARVAVVAWTKSKVGSAQADVIIRDPVVVAGVLPRFLSLGDRSRFFLQIENVEGQAGEYTIDLDARGPISVNADALHATVRLAAGGKTTLNVPVTAAGVGLAVIDLRLTGPGIDASQSFALKMQPGTSDLYRRTVRNLAPGESVTLTADILGDFLPGTGAVSASVSPFGAIDVPGLLRALDRYPYGCSEQTVSRAMPLLYVNKLASVEQLAFDGALDERIRAAIEKVLTRQDSNGDFGLWSAGGGEDMWLNAYVMDFLTRAREQGFEVPQKNFDATLERLRNFVANTPEADRGKDNALAYAIYVLARNGRPVMGDLRYIADTKVANFSSPLARAQIAAALAMLGDRARAEAIFNGAADYLRTTADPKISRSDYGSKLRDAAGMMALVAEARLSAANGEQPLLLKANLVVDEISQAQRYTSTQENAWLVLAAQALARDAANLTLDVNGANHQGAFFRNWKTTQLEARPVTIANRGQGPAHLVVTTSGNPIVPEPEASQGYKIEREYYRPDGAKLDQLSLKQNERVVVVLKLTEPEAKYARLLVVDKLPAGLEIDNPKLVDGSALEGLNWLKKDVEPDHTEYRDDRFVAAFERSSGQPAFFSVAYIARAVAPGRYVLPPATAEDMYRPERFGRTAFGAFEVIAAQP